MNPIRTLAATSILESFVFFGSLSGLIPNEASRRTMRLLVNRKLARTLSRAIQLRIRTVPTDLRPRGNWGRLILANHLSILDVIALASLEEAIFVTSRDMGETPGIGALARMGGVVFVERRNRSEREAELSEFERLLREGRTIVLFPEATSGDGEKVLRFRNGLLHAALRVPRVEILPVCLNYHRLGSEPITARNRDRVFLYGEMSVARHIWNLFTNRAVKMTVEYLEPFFAGECKGVQEIAERAESQVREAFIPIASD